MKKKITRAQLKKERDREKKRVDKMNKRMFEAMLRMGMARVVVRRG